ncbi:MAG: adenine nucleotide alpha hydrolase [Thiotrichaceae bacterium]|nr:adenine nucleotide alpha hydrolase [Thiotrichaceae bacterium]
MKKSVLLSWSSGKDSAWALHVLRQQNEFDVVGLFTTVNQVHDRVAMHAVRRELLMLQAQHAGLPLEVIEIPDPCSNADYEQRMGAFMTRCQQRKIDCFAFGDLYLEDIREYREQKMAGSGIDAIFPLWGCPTAELSQTMIDGGLRAHLTCVDPRCLDRRFAGREFDRALLDELPMDVDPCGENGEFHSFVFAGPMLDGDIDVSLGEIVERGGFVFADLLAGAKEGQADVA